MTKSKVKQNKIKQGKVKLPRFDTIKRVSVFALNCSETLEKRLITEKDAIPTTIIIK